MDKALEIASIFASHALKAFDMMGADKSLEEARKIWQWIKRNQYMKFSKRDCFDALKGYFKKVTNMDEAFKILIERNYLKEEKKDTGGRPSIQFYVNPKFTKEW